ncbi:MAG: hypothetical protein V4632_09705 [Pseudomonadota bacterium]
MNKSILTIGGVVLVLAIGLGCFHLGRGVGEESVRQRSERETYLLLNLNAIASYASYAEISAQISDGKLNQAKCTANVVASGHLRQVKECLGQRGCRDVIYDEVKKRAPELLDGSKLKFTYYENAEACFSANPDKK